ncbi:MAG: cupredoxin domain-containing protein [Candidatus Norongarragalinales archaeon]
MLEKGALILLGLIALGILGVGLLIFSIPSTSGSGINTGQQPTDEERKAQVVEITATASGYEPSTVRVKAGVPVELRLTADKTAGCSRSFVMKDFGIRAVAESGKIQTFRFTPPAGEFVYRCSMNMFRGKLVAE